MSSSSRSMREGRRDMDLTIRTPPDGTTATARHHGFDPCRAGPGARQGEPGGGCRAAPRARLQRPARSTSRAASGWTTRGRSASASSRATPASPSRCTRRSPGFLGQSERDKKHRMAIGMLDHSAGVAAACGAELVVIHPGFLLGRTHEDAIGRGGRAARRAARAARGEGPRGAVRGRGDGPRPRARHGRGRLRDRRAAPVGAARDRLRPPARGHGRRLHRRRGVRRRARGRRRDPGARRAVPHPFQRHRVREPERDEASALRRGDAAGGAARGGAAEVQAPGDRDLRVAGRGVVSDDPLHPAREGGAESGRRRELGAGARGRRPPPRRGRGSARNSSSRDRIQPSRPRKSVDSTIASASQQQRLRLVVAALRRPDEPERHRRRRLRGDVVLGRRSRSPPARRARPRRARPRRTSTSASAALALAERAAVLERLQQPDRLAQPALGARRGRPAARPPRRASSASARASRRRRPRRTGTSRLLELLLAEPVSSPLQLEAAERVERLRPRDDAAALLRELEPAPQRLLAPRRAGRCWR